MGIFKKNGFEVHSSKHGGVTITSGKVKFGQGLDPDEAKAKLEEYGMKPEEADQVIKKAQS